MLSQVLGGGRQRGQGGPNEYTPAGPSTFRPANRYHQFNGCELGGQQSPTVKTSDSVTNHASHSGKDMANHHHWYQPVQPAPYYITPSNSREMRNKAEKQRRDRLNSFIGELAALVPLVSRSAKRMDKTSILRLTATHLRIYQTLASGRGVPQMQLPKHVDQFVLEQLICDQMGGFLLIMSPNGKIIFISHTVETLLGHLQTDLMGQSLFTITATEDHDRLRMYLMCEGEMEQGWRKYFSIKLKRAGPRSETPVFEPVRMMGVHRQLQPPEPNPNSMSSGASTSSIQSSINTDILVFFVKICRPEPLVDRLVAASKDEYVTRHLIDARIIDCDQRISLIAGYMIEEIQGHSAFMYMHREDVRYVMIALRQMYDRGESRGNSCYRLKSRNGQFIYLKTFGFLEIDDQGIVESFLCVNMLVDEKEGKLQIKDMKRRYSAMFTSSLSSLPYQENSEVQSPPKVQEILETTTQTPLSPPHVSEVKLDSTEDPQTLQQAVNELMQNLPSPGSDESEESSSVRSHSVDSKPESVDNSAQVSDSGKGKHMMYNESAAAHKTPQIRIKTGGKRAPSVSPDHVKRQRLTSVDSEPPQLSPPINPSVLPFPKRPPLSKMPKLEEQYPATPTDVLRRQHHHAA